MANSTFSGPVRSKNGFQTISENSTTGAITVTSGTKMSAEAVGSAGIEGTAADRDWETIFGADWSAKR